jgi:hypothetical protein
MKANIKDDFANSVKAVKTKKKLSVGERIMKNIPVGKFSYLLQILEPHEIPDNKNS